MRAAIFKRGLVALFAAVGAAIFAMIVFHPVGEPWLWAALFVVYIPLLLIVLSVCAYLVRMVLRLRR